MSLKRSLGFPNVFPVKKRRYVNAVSSIGGENGEFDFSTSNVDLIEIPNDTKAALLYLKSIFPVHKFKGRIPAIILKHQLYCIVKDKTIADRQLNDMWERNEVRLFKLFSGSDEFAVMLTNDYVTHLQSKVTDTTAKTIEKFVTEVLPSCIDVSFSRTTLIDQHKLSEDEITHLINVGALAVRDVGNWWLSIPGAGQFMKNFSKGRKALVRMIKNRKYREILQNELESRSLSTHSKLGMAYHIHDLIGAELVKRIETTSGQLLRLHSS